MNVTGVFNLEANKYVSYWHQMIIGPGPGPGLGPGTEGEAPLAIESVLSEGTRAASGTQGLMVPIGGSAMRSHIHLAALPQTTTTTRGQQERPIHWPCSWLPGWQVLPSGGHRPLAARREGEEDLTS